MGYINDDGLTRLWAKIKGLFNNSVTDISPASGNTLTLTKGDGTTKQITTHDTTYSVFSGSTSSAAGTSGLVPAPSANAKTGILSTNGSFLYPALSTLRSETHQSVIFSLKDANGVTIYSSPELGIGDNDGILPATDSMAGIMTAADKAKLDAIGTTYISIPQSGTGEFGQFLRSNGDGTYYWSNSTVAEHDHDDIYYRKSEISDLLSGYLPITGGTLTGPVTITRPGQSWVASATTPNIYNIANTSGANAWIGGKTLNGRITIGAYPSNDNYLYFNYYLDSRISAGTNGQDAFFYWAANLKKLYLGNNTIQFQTGDDLAVIQNYYNDRYYNLIRNHNNGNVSVSASSAGLYLGYENTTFVNFLNGKMSLNSNGDLSLFGKLQVGNANADAGIEIYHATPYIDFHFGRSSADYTSRIIEASSGVLSVSGALSVGNALTVGGNQTFSSTSPTIWMNGKIAMRAINDNWLRIADGNDFTNGVYFGNRLIRTDGDVRVGTGTADSLFTDVNKGAVAVRYGSYNALQMVADANGQVRLWRRTANNTSFNLISCANNSTAITAGGNWTFANTIAGNISGNAATSTKAPIKVQVMSNDNLSVAANSRLQTDFTPTIPSGYSIVGITGIRFDNASSSGANSSNMRLQNYYLTDNLMRVWGYNDGAAAKVKVTVLVVMANITTWQS